MSTPTSRARFLRGGLVGGCSAVLSLVAHSVGGGGLPGGGAVALVLVLCAGVGVAAAALRVVGRVVRAFALVTSLAAGQVLGHLTLAVGGHHGGSSFGVSFGVRMLAAHVVATVALGLLIGLAEYLFVVGESVLGWLRLILVARTRVGYPGLPRYANPVVVESILLSAGLGMRAPPVRSFA